MPQTQPDLKSYSHTCMCSAYPWPHHMGLGKCAVTDLDEPVCASCGHHFTTVAIDFGVGSYEYCGHKSFDTDIRSATGCCENTQQVLPREGITQEIPQ
jgi:hypothetical protein